MCYSLRTLLILTILGPPTLAGVASLYVRWQRHQLIQELASELIKEQPNRK